MSSISNISGFDSSFWKKQLLSSQSSQRSLLLGSIPQSHKPVLDSALMYRIYDARALTPQIVQNYQDKVEAAEADQDSEAALGIEETSAKKEIETESLDILA